MFVFTATGIFADTELNIPGHRIVWHDEFEAAEVDPANWDVNVGVNAWYQRASDGRFVEPHWFNEDFEPWLSAGTINGERQYYSPNNVSINSGILEIRSDKETVPDPIGLYDPGFHEYTSGKLNTADEFQFTFGIVRWRAQLPAGQGMWPALWMLNAPDPWFWDDEIDVMEARGSEPTITTSAHHFKVDDGNGGLNNFYNTDSLNAGVNLQQGFHDYTLEWTSSSIQTWLDDTTVFYDDVAIPQGPMFLIMNAAVGGFFDGAVSDDSIFPTYFKIDWVRVWQPASTPTDMSNGGFESAQGLQWADWNTFDDGNLSHSISPALHGSQSVLIGRPNNFQTGSEVTLAPNLFTDGTAGGWQGYLNEQDSGGNVTSGGFIDPATIPATLSTDGAVLPIHQSASSPRANAVVFRQFDGVSIAGLDLIFSGSVVIEETFPAGTEAKAFIRIFDPGFNFYDVATSVIDGGEFQLNTVIPTTGVSIVQVGLETTGPTGSAGRLAASGLYFGEGETGEANPENRTGFVQLVNASPGMTFDYGLLTSNSSTDPIGSGTIGQLSVEFLKADGQVISRTEVELVNGSSPSQAVPFKDSIVAPTETAYARLAIERVSTDPASDTSGGFLADAIFLQNTNSTELPLFLAEPVEALTVDAGDPVNLGITVSSATALSYQWYHDGTIIATDEDLTFATTPESGGTYFVVASNDAGPVVAAITEITVLNPDTDGDGIGDYNEINLYGTDPLLVDSDYDKISDFKEIFITKTDPLDASSALRTINFGVVSGELNLSFSSVTGVTYILEASPDLVQWNPLGTSFTATTAISTTSETIPVSDPPIQFFRIRVVP